MRKHYYYVRCKTSDVLRFAEGTTIQEACIDAFGCLLRGVEVKDLGTRHPRYFSDKKKRELKLEETGWQKVL